MADLLSGIKVVDFTQYLAGPTVTRMMVELGADIIKIEQAPAGDPSRLLPIVVDGRSGFYVQQNRGKRSLCVDFDQPEGAEIVRDLVRQADVVVENYGPGVLEKRGFDHESLLALNPSLVYCSISAFGRNGPYANKTGYDMIAQAFSGLMHMTGERNGPPMFVGSGMADVSTGVHALAAVGIALFHRLRTGEGQWLDISMVDCMFHYHEIAVQAVSLTGGRAQPSRSGRHAAGAAPVGTFKSRDGWIVILALDRQWERLPEAMGRPDLLTDERFATSRSRGKNRDVLVPIIEEWLQSFPDDDAALEELEKYRIPAGPVLSPADALTHPYFQSREMVRTVPDPVLGEITIPGMPLRFSASPERPELVAPLLGQHNADILGELGYDGGRVAALESSGVLARGET